MVTKPRDAQIWTQLQEMESEPSWSLDNEQQFWDGKQYSWWQNMLSSVQADCPFSFLECTHLEKKKRNSTLTLDVFDNQSWKRLSRGNVTLMRSSTMPCELIWAWRLSIKVRAPSLRLLDDRVYIFAHNIAVLYRRWRSAPIPTRVLRHNPTLHHSELHLCWHCHTNLSEGDYRRVPEFCIWCLSLLLRAFLIKSLFDTCGLCPKANYL
jgi:hypothetical protein